MIYGQLEHEIQKTALGELSKILLDYTLEYPTCLKYSEDLKLSPYQVIIYLGTKENNPYIQKSSPAVLSQEEQYFLQVENNTVLIEGYDDAGVLYGVVDFYHKYIGGFEYPGNSRYWINPFEKETLPDFSYSSCPSVRERGLWTWGHVIYDYRGYLDNMMRLKLNRVIIWNDYAPVNAAEIVAYAHARNIAVIWGFSWLWDTGFANLDLNHLEGESERILEKYEREYAGIGGDGIYFQTFTELRQDNLGGVLIAEAAAAFVNRTAALFFEKYPDIKIQFGLHATSVKTRLEYLRAVDPRIRIVWEDCGSLPFSYGPQDIRGFEETKRFVQTIAHLRGEDDCFGVVTKGLTKLDWSQFEHMTGPQVLGVSSEGMKENRIARKHRIWRFIQAYWLIHADKVYEMVQEMCRLKEGDLCIAALLEDGMFEENIMYPVALYAEMLWDCHADIKTLMKDVALRNYVIFA